VLIGNPTHFTNGRWPKNMPLPMPKIIASDISTPLSRNKADVTPLSQCAEW
jgi:hypothetical protein